MECFNNLVSVRELCDTTAPKSAIYMDDIGISKADLNDFILPAYPTLQEYFDNRFQFAVTSVASEIYSHFSDRYVAASIIDSHTLGYFDRNLNTQLGVNFRGINMDMNQADSFFSFTIAQIDLFLNYTGDVDVVIYDLDQDLLLHTETIACTSGKVSTAFLHKTFTSSQRPKNIFIGYDSTGITAIKTPIRANLCCGKTTCENTLMRAKGVEIDGSFVVTNMETLNHTAGVSITYSMECDHQNWICSHAKKFALPLAYKTAEILVSDALLNTNGERATNSNTINREELERRYDFFRGKYNETVGAILKNMQPPSNRCFSCRQTSRHVISLP